MGYTDARGSAGYFLVARRNHSLSSKGRQFVLASFIVVFLAISLAFAAVGAWPVMPFAGLELAAVYWAFRCIERRSTDFESVIIDGDQLVIERQDNGHRNRFEFNTYWAQVRWIPSRVGQRAALVVHSHGNEVVFGRHLPEEKIREVATRIRLELKSPNAFSK